MSSPPTVAELEAKRDAIVAAFNACIADPSLCTALSAAITVLGETRQEMIDSYNARCGEYTAPEEP